MGSMQSGDPCGLINGIQRIAFSNQQVTEIEHCSHIFEDSLNEI